MKLVKLYKCDYCGETFDYEYSCLHHEDKHKKFNEANRMLYENKTLKEINDKLNIWSNLPEYLYNVTKDNCFTIDWWQCCNKPAYQIIKIDMSGKLQFDGKGSWSGYYSSYCNIDDYNLKNPRPKEELFIYND